MTVQAVVILPLCDSQRGYKSTTVCYSERSLHHMTKKDGVGLPFFAVPTTCDTMIGSKDVSQNIRRLPKHPIVNQQHPIVDRQRCNALVQETKSRTNRSKDKRQFRYHTKCSNSLSIHRHFSLGMVISEFLTIFSIYLYGMVWYYIRI